MFNGVYSVSFVAYINAVKASLGSNGYEHLTDKNLKWRKFNTVILDLGLFKLNIK
jgi:hypothetical protein